MRDGYVGEAADSPRSGLKATTPSGFALAGRLLFALSDFLPRDVDHALPMCRVAFVTIEDTVDFGDKQFECDGFAVADSGKARVE